MNFKEFKKSVSDENPPGNLSGYLISLWYDARGDWHKAHETIQDVEDRNAYWIHAYLHRKEGDAGNAGYWYNRAGKNVPLVSVDEEWKNIAEHFLDRR